MGFSIYWSPLQKNLKMNIKIQIFLPPRGSFVIVKFRVSLNLSRNIIRGVRTLYHMILENVCMDVCVCACVCVRIPLYLRIYAVDFNRTVLMFFVFFYSVFGMKIIFYDSPIHFCFISNFWFSKKNVYFQNKNNLFIYHLGYFGCSSAKIS